MTDVASGVARISAKNAAATQASVDPHLEPGEEALVLQPVRPKGGKWSVLTFPRIEVTPAVELPKECVLAVTQRRFLVVEYHVRTGGEMAMLISRPLDEVRSVQRARALGSTELSWTVGDTQYVVWANPSMAKQLAEALQPGSA